jgi:hypothetical protein
MIRTVGIAGDWHGNINHAMWAVKQMEPHLGEEKIIYQLGDFGYWPDADNYSSFTGMLSRFLGKLRVRLAFLDGNHENHANLKEKIDDYIGDYATAPARDLLIPIAPNIEWMARGYRFFLGGREWLVCGGAASVDRAWREEGRSWFPGELITDEQEEKICREGYADVLLSHDRPAKAPIDLKSGVWPEKDVAIADAHRERLQRICSSARPSYIMHGHYHMAMEDTVDMGWGDVRINGFTCDGYPGNWGILDVETMEWVHGG